MIEIIKEGMSKDASILHLFLHVPSEHIPWTVSRKLYIFNYSNAIFYKTDQINAIVCEVGKNFNFVSL